MGNRREYLVNNIVKICRRLDQKGFGANHDGNVTARFENVLLATPMSISKGDVTPETIITLDMDGKKTHGIGKPFSEIGLHLAAYRVRDDIMAVVHAHPPFATAMGLAGKEIRPSLPEAVVSIGDIIPVAEYNMPASDENVWVISRMLEKTDVFMVCGNGVFATGSDLEQAYLRLELVEHLAKIEFYAEAMGRKFELPEGDVKKLAEKHASLFPRRKAIDTSAQQGRPEAADADLKGLIAEEIKRILQGN